MAANKLRIFPNLSDPSATPSHQVCTLCGSQAAEFIWVQIEGAKCSQGWCPACTNVCITEQALNSVKAARKAHLLSAFLCRLPSEKWADEIGSAISEEIWPKLIASVTELVPLDQFDATLKLICEMCPSIGRPSQFLPDRGWPLVALEGTNTALYILGQLQDAGYITLRQTATTFDATPTWKGYERLQQIQFSGRHSRYAFVAMAFASEQMSVWEEVIEPGIKGAGYSPIRVDKYPHDNRIDDEIIAGIQRSRFLVADFTLQRNGVYFEAGLARGLGRHVISMCNEREKTNLHFDTRQFYHIFYSDTDLKKARTQLTDRIVALEGEGDFVVEQVQNA